MIILHAWWEMNLRGPKVNTGRSVRKLESDPHDWSTETNRIL